VIHPGRCRQGYYTPTTNLFHYSFFSRRHSYSPLSAGSFSGLSSPTDDYLWKPYQRDEGEKLGLGTRPEDIVPVFKSGAQSHYRGIEGDHGLSHGVSSGIGVKAAVDAKMMIDEVGEPSGIWPGSSGGDAEMAGMEDTAADCINGRFAEDDC